MAGVLLAGCAAPREPADLVLLGGKLVTVDSARPAAEGLAARDGRIVAVGSDEEVRGFVGPGTRVIELQGKLAVPGFIESHAHFTSIGRERQQLDVSGARSWDEVVARVAEAVAEARPEEWIVGRGWHQEKWSTRPEPSVEGYPVHDALSRISPNHPVLLTHASGHAGFVNARTLEILGIDGRTPDPPGGAILHDGAGRPSGLLREAANHLADAAYEAALERRTPEERDTDARREIELASRECLAKGITTFQDAGSDSPTIRRLREFAESGAPGPRLWVMIGPLVTVGELEQWASDVRVVGAAEERFTVRAIKRQIDGALGSHTAWLLEAYSDLPLSAGMNTTPLEEIERAAEFAIDHDFQLCVHAIGDRGNRETLDLYERVFRSRPQQRDLRWRIEHAQHLATADVPRFAQLGVIASMQGIHCTSDGSWVPARIGARRAAEGAYLWRELLDSGAVVCNGTDAPVENVDPIANFYASVTRRMADGEAFYPEQRMTRLEALRSYTLDAAYAAFEDDVKGSLVPGKLADVTVLSRDIMSVPDGEIPGTEVLYTIVGGKVVYERERS